MGPGSRGCVWPSLGTRRARGWLFLLLLALECLCSAFALSTCKTVDMDLMKRKRIEAIRGQILSKLKLSSPPEVEVPESQPLPDDVRALYNSTLQFIKERVDEELPEAPHDDYYAKEVHKFDMLLPTDASYARYPKTRHSIYFVFNLEEIRGILSSPNMLYRAELRMRAAGMGQEQRLELYQEHIDSRNDSSWYYLDGRMIKLKSDKEWLSFDVTHVLRLWSESSERYGRFRLSAHCTCGSGPEELKVDIEGMKVKRGDQLQLSQNHQLRPFLLVMVVPPHRAESQSRRYKRDAPGLDYCSQSSEEKNCCVRPLYIDFRKDLKWKWIHEPKGYYANFCMGPCPYLWSLDTQYSKVLSLYTQHNPSASASPCCVPSELEPLGIVYYVGRQAKVEQLSNMVVKSCRCS